MMEFPTEIDALLDWIKTDIELSDVDEFPVSSMSECVSRTLLELIGSDSRLHEPATKALDMGCGSGVHTAVMLHAGIPEVLACDVQPQAVRCAELRINRLMGANLVDKDARIGCQVSNVRIDAPLALHDDYQLMCFNAPGFVKMEGEIADTPLEVGVYVSTAESDEKPDLLFDFLSNWVRPCLKVGGYAVVTWPFVLNRSQVVHEDSAEQADPLIEISRRLGWRIDTAVARRLVHTSTMANYGSARVLDDLGHPDATTHFAPDMLQQQVFRYVVLVIKRTSENSFEECIISTS